MKTLTLAALSLTMLAGCGPANQEAACPGPDCPGCPGPDCGDPALKADDFNELNTAAGTTVLYEVQARTANACRPDTGADWQRAACEEKIAPDIPYNGPGCWEIDRLKEIKLGTLDDMLEDTADHREGITLRYIHERVSANMVWFMPVFPNNDRYNLPHECDDLGSPYAVRDYLHARGTLSRACILDGRDEYAERPCFGNQTFEEVIDAAHARGLRVMMDVAFNHFGHNYLMYDVVDFEPVRGRIGRGADLDTLWDFAATETAAHLHPEILDTSEELEAHADAEELAALRERCPGLRGQELVLAYNMWRVALDWEREVFPCEPVFLEYAVPGFYLGANHRDPSTRPGDNFTNNWVDVKFLYHHRDNPSHQWEYVRNREYLFRVMNYWVSRGVDGFRLDHTTDADSGMSAEEWDYIISKVDYYAWRRGQARPIFLAEEFHDQMDMSRVVDVMIDGYVGDMNGRNGTTKDASHVERVIRNPDRFGGKTYVMTALETHDEHRLLDGTGFDVWTGAGFWGIGASTWSTPMLLMGQEFGEPWGLAFRRTDFLRGRFEGSGNDHPDALALVDFYRGMISSRIAWKNRALFASPRHFLRTRDRDGADPRIFAQVKWSGDGNVVFVFHNLWQQDVSQSYYIPPQIGDALWIRDGRWYRLVDVLSGAQAGPCRAGADLKWDLYVSMPAHECVQWLRLEACD